MRSPARIIPLLIAAAMAAMLLVAAPAVAADPGLRAALTPTGGTGVELVLTNDGDTPIAVPTWLTGAHGIDDAILVVTRDGAPAPYAGMLAKRDDTAPGATTTIGPHASARWVLDVATAYALTSAGAYAVRYRAQMPDGTTVASNAVAITATAGSALKTPGAAGRGVMSIGYTGCNAGEQTQVLAALGAANTYATTAVQYFSANRAGARYQQWFGAYLSARWNAVASHFTAIQAVTGGTNAAFVCHDVGCTAGVFAFVYPNAPYSIYVCGAFWDAAVTGTDSRAGTLIHEISHFTVVAGTSDHAYGQAAAMALAGSTPAQAVSNADNHEYFAENTAPVEYATYSTSTGPLAFADTAIGASSGTTTVTVTSSGDIPLVPTGAVATGDFAIAGDTCTGATLAPTATCQIMVRFAPTAAGARSGALSLQGNLDIVPSALALSGNGTASAPGETPAPAPQDAAPTPVASPEPAASSSPAPVAAIAPLKVATACRAPGACTVAGTVPAGATRVTIRAVARGKAAARGTCPVAKRGATRTYSCSIRLTRGTWTVTTEAIGPDGVVARSTRRIVR